MNELITSRKWHSAYVTAYICTCAAYVTVILKCPVSMLVCQYVSAYVSESLLGFRAQLGMRSISIYKPVQNNAQVEC